MSNLSVRGNVSGTGTIVVESPNTNTSRNLTLPDASGTMLAAASPAAVGQFELSSTNFLATPTAGGRGVVPSMQFYRLNTGFVGANVTTAQSLLGVGVTLSASTVYAFEIMAYLSKTVGATSHVMNLLYGGTATLNNIAWSAAGPTGAGGAGGSLSPTSANAAAAVVATAVGVSVAIASANSVVSFRIGGTVSINAGGTFIPQYLLSAAPGGAYTTQPGTYMLIYPIGAAGVTTNIGSWA